MGKYLSLYKNSVVQRRWWWYERAQELERQNTRLYNEKRNLEHRVGNLVYQNISLSNEKDDLKNQLEKKRRAVSVYLGKVSTLEYKVQELENQNTKLSGELVKQREDMRKAGLMFMNAADTYQQLAKKQIRTKEEELANTRKAGLLLINATDKYQELARKQIKAKVEDLEDARKAVLVVMNAADTYQHVAEKKIKDKVEELRVLGVQKAEMDARAASLESGSRKEAAANAFDAEKAETMKELEDHKMDVEEIPTTMDLMKGENDNIQLEVLTAAHQHSSCEAGVERLRMELDVLLEVKDTCKIMESGDLNGEVKEIPAAHFMKSEYDKLQLDILTAEHKHILSEAQVDWLKENI
ncbi:hypothetical protein OsJ_13716 [Oryza sativa Japonica Group]|uniref:Uncharacterized protein n=1 Tax=Oryza sativa subsp. japonica TaxID=39947 RepID=B9FDJ8_ORYSJ|nr:hypothetical protein OsJ_13716 [Oryza sativa Japonica Group]